MKNKNQKPSICTICDSNLDSGLEDRLVESLPSIRRWPYDRGLIKVHLPDKHIPVMLQHYNLHYNVAVVIIKNFCCTRTAIIDNKVKTGTHSEALAIGCVYESGKLMAASGTAIDKGSELNCKVLRISTCQITKTGIGGPLIDFNGNFIGMNFYGLEETPYIPWDTILKLLENFDAEGTDLLHSERRRPEKRKLMEGSEHFELTRYCKS